MWNKWTLFCFQNLLLLYKRKLVDDIIKTDRFCDVINHHQFRCSKAVQNCTSCISSVCTGGPECFLAVNTCPSSCFFPPLSRKYTATKRSVFNCTTSATSLPVETSAITCARNYISTSALNSATSRTSSSVTWKIQYVCLGAWHTDIARHKFRVQFCIYFRQSS